MVHQSGFPQTRQGCRALTRIQEDRWVGIPAFDAPMLRISFTVVSC